MSTHEIHISLSAVIRLDNIVQTWSAIWSAFLIKQGV